MQSLFCWGSDALQEDVNLAGKRSGHVLDGVIYLLGLFCSLEFLRTLLTLHLAIPFDPNEGWNAYFATAAVTDGRLYPDPNTYMINNYPPLSFYLVGTVGTLLGDNILAGRVISILAFLSIAVGIWLAARRMGCGSRGASFAALLLSTYLIAVTDYVGLNDPQLIGHAVGMWGMILLLREPRTEPAIFWAALLLSLAFFVKHNLITQPLVLVLWLTLYDPRSALRLAVWGSIFLAMGLVAFRLAYGTDLLTQLRSARVYSFANLANGVAQWLVWGLLPLLATAFFVWFERSDKYAVLCGTYVVTAFLLGAIFMSGDGVDLNAMFDADIALALAAGLFVSRWARKGVAQSATIVAAYAMPLIFGLWQASGDEWLDLSYWTDPSADETRVAGNDIAFLRGQSGPVLCEMLALCYWARKSAEVDVFNVGQQFAMKERTDDELVGLVAKQHYAAIQFNSLTDFPLTPRVRDALAKAYRLDHEDDLGVFFLPRRHPR
jgi:Dolichyl-phosphate-mannose-protein mannosyltransferase